MVREERGFTLIELLVVIAIIGILSSVVLASLNSARAKGRDARRISDLRQLQLALELYYSSNGQYPVQTTSIEVNETNLGGLTPDSIPALPDDPSGGQDYWYISNAGGSNYCLGANLESTAPVASNLCTGLDPAHSTDYRLGP